MPQESTTDIFSQIDEVWTQVKDEVFGPFTTQQFREMLVLKAPDIWGAMTERWGPGGRGSGKFYSPANVLYNYLHRKAVSGELLEHGFVPSNEGWGTGRVMQFELADRKGLPPAEEDIALVEGGRRLRTHLVRERASGLRDLLLRSRSKSGLRCDLCQLDGAHLPGELRASLFEAHHDVGPLSVGGQRETKLKDMSLLCACCHRLLHKIVALRGDWRTVAQVRQELAFESATSSELRAI